MVVEKDFVDFEKDVIEASHKSPVLVDFWAPWCGPCRILGPTLKKVAEEAGDEWTLLKVNTDHQPDLSVRFNIRGIPTVKLFVNGVDIGGFVGALPEQPVRELLGENLPATVD
ncbi:MAG: thioredoxin family protein [Fidelibacterota bacterium]